MVDLRTFRAANNIKQKDLSEYLNVTAPYLSQIEAGLRPLSKALIEKIADNPYDWDLSYLYKESPSVLTIKNIGNKVHGINADDSLVVTGNDTSESPTPNKEAKATKGEVAQIVAAYEKSEKLNTELNKKLFAMQLENQRLKDEVVWLRNLISQSMQK